MRTHENGKRGRPKNHEKIDCGTFTAFFRNGGYADTVFRDTPTLKKTRNLFCLLLESDKSDDGDLDSVDAEAFCKLRKISLSNYRRLYAILREYNGDGPKRGNAFAATPTNRKYLVLLSLFEALRLGTVDLRKFCTCFRISRTTFFRYLSVIGNFFCHEDDSQVVALTDRGEYCVICLDR